MEIKKDASELYSILSDILDCDYRRLIQAFDGINGDILSSAIYEARENENFTLDGIMREVIDLGFSECNYYFYKERDGKLSLLNEDSEEYEILDNLDVDIIKDSIQYEDGICWSELFSEYSEEEMKIYLTYLKESFEKLVNLIGYIDGLPME